MRIQSFGRKFLALLQHEFIQVGKNGRIEPDAVFHQKYHLHAYFLHIVFEVHLIFHQFDNRNQQVGIAQPAEHVFKCAQVFVDNPLCNTMTERSQDNDRNMFVFLFNMPPDIKTVIVSRTRHTDHQIE